ncbi:MAG: TRAP transporter small permease subunit [Inquilinaceae bacterium]
MTADTGGTRPSPPGEAPPARGHWVDSLALTLGRLAGWSFPVIALLMGYEVVSRYVFGAPTIWAHEISGLLAGIAFIAGGAYCMAEGSHMRVSLLIDGAGRARRRLAEMLSFVTGAVFLVGLAVGMWGIVQRSLFRFATDGTWTPERSGSSWNTPSPAYLKLALLVGALVFLLVVVRQAIQLARGGTPAGMADAGEE